MNNLLSTLDKQEKQLLIYCGDHKSCNCLDPYFLPWIVFYQMNWLKERDQINILLEFSVVKVLNLRILSFLVLMVYPCLAILTLEKDFIELLLKFNLIFLYLYNFKPIM